MYRTVYSKISSQSLQEKSPKRREPKHKSKGNSRYECEEVVPLKRETYISSPPIWADLSFHAIPHIDVENTTSSKCEPVIKTYQVCDKCHPVLPCNI